MEKSLKSDNEAIFSVLGSSEKSKGNSSRWECSAAVCDMNHNIRHSREWDNEKKSHKIQAIS